MPAAEIDELGGEMVADPERHVGEALQRVGKLSRGRVIRTQAALDAPVLAKALTRFRLPWRWDGQPVVLQSRAWDEAGNVQPTRVEMFAERGEPKVNVPVTAFPMGHMNVITSRAIDNNGEAKHAYG
jgi:hypothetical protein